MSRNEYVNLILAACAIILGLSNLMSGKYAIAILEIIVGCLLAGTLYMRIQKMNQQEENKSKKRK